MNITQTYNNDLSHEKSSRGKPSSYPIDEAGQDSGRDYFYAPCDLIVKRVYGLGNNGANTIWLESLNPVKLANNTTSYVTIMVMHPNDDTLKSFKVGQTYQQKTQMFLEGTDGNTTGNHFHIEVANCRFSELKNNGWVENSEESWVLSNNSIKPEEAFFIDENFTTIKNTAGLNFKKLSAQSASYQEGTYQTLTEIYVRTGPGTNYPIKKYQDLTKDGQKNAQKTAPTDHAIYKAGTIFTASQIINNDDKSVWAQTPSGFVCLKQTDGQSLVKLI